MRIRRGFLNWGVFLICLGAVPLAVQGGAIPPSVASEIVRLWPVILIGIGLGLLLRFSRFEALGGVVVAGTAGLLLGSLLSGGVSSFAAACSGGQAGGTPITHSGTADSSLSLQVELTCGDMDVNRAPGNAWSVQVQAGNETPAIQANGPTLSLRSATNVGFGPFGGDQRENWQVTLPTDTALSAGITVNAGTTRLLLGNGALNDINATYNAADGLLDLSSEVPGTAVSLNATLNASSVAINMPAGQLNADMTINASSLELCVPPSVGLRISYDDTLSSHNFGAAGLVQSGDSWTTVNYASASVRSDLDLSANVSSTTINPAGGCR